MQALKMNRVKTITMALILTVLTPGMVRAGAFALLEQGAREMGTAYAGMAALAETPSTIFFNPAGLTRLEGHQAQVVVNYFLPYIKFKDQGSTTLLGAPLTGCDGGNAGGDGSLAPNLYYSYKFTDWLAAGLGVETPFGVANENNNGWKGRYYALETTIETININPTLAFGPFKDLSIGIGFIAQRLEATLSNAVDWGLIGNLAGLGTTPQSLDGKAELSGNNWGYGINAGLLYEFTDSARVGLTYRSHIVHDVDGEATFSTPPAAALLAQVLGLVDTKGSSEIELPEMLSLSAHFQVTERVALLMDVTWTGWSRLDELRVKFDSGAQEDVTTLGWEDTLRYAVGATFDPEGKWSFRIGYALDESPVPSIEMRNPRVPDADRYWITLGGSYDFTERFGIDLAFAHFIFKDLTIDKKTYLLSEDVPRGNLKGDVDGSVNIFSLQLRLAL